MVDSSRFLGIVLVDPAAKSPGFKEWGEEKMASWSLETKGFTSTAEKFLIWHLFGTVSCHLWYFGKKIDCDASKYTTYESFVQLLFLVIR